MKNEKLLALGRLSEISLAEEDLKRAQEVLESFRVEAQTKAEIVTALEMKMRGAAQRRDAEKSRVRQDSMRIKLSDYESERRRTFNEELRELESEMSVKDKEFQSFYNGVRRRLMEEEVGTTCH